MRQVSHIACTFDVINMSNQTYVFKQKGLLAIELTAIL